MEMKGPCLGTDLGDTESGPPEKQEDRMWQRKNPIPYGIGLLLLLVVYGVHRSTVRLSRYFPAKFLESTSTSCIIKNREFKTLQKFGEGKSLPRGAGFFKAVTRYYQGSLKNLKVFTVV